MTLNLDRYAGIIFDMDGTLIDTMPSHAQAWQLTAEQFDFPYDKEWLHQLGGMPSSNIVSQINQHYGLTLDPKQVSEFKMQSFEQIEEKGEPIAVTLDILTQIQNKKKTALGTGSQRVGAMALLEKHQLTSLLDTIVTATEVSKHKPNPDTFLLAAQQLGLDSHQCAVFEDTELGKQAAHAAGMDCYLVKDNQLHFYPYLA